MTNLRRIPLTHAHNTRDLGGYATAAGRVTAWGRLYRSDNVGNLDAGEWAQMAGERGIATVIDLRSTAESQGSPVNAPEGVTVVHHPLMGNLEGVPDLAQVGPEQAAQMAQAEGAERMLESMKLDYAKTTYENIDTAAAVLGAIVDGLPRGAVLFQCSAGKDRTGITAALVLWLAGVAREDIIADYQVSATYNEPGINEKIRSLPPELMAMIPDPSLLEGVMASDPKMMRALLDRFEAEPIRDALAGAGFGADRQAALVEAVTID